MPMRKRNMRPPLITGVLGAVVLAAACSSSSPAHTTGPSTSTPSTSTSSTGGPSTTAQLTSGTHPCTRAVTAAPTVTPVAGSSSDRTMMSFDGARIRLHWFPLPAADAAHPAPTVVMGPGWGSGGDTNITPAGGGEGVFGALSIAGLRAHGYNVLTWDPRGFGASTGTVTTDDPQHEGRDVSRILDWIATQPGVELDRPGDPRVGMAGGSYGGGIQFAVAAFDCRVDAIVPWIAWHSLGTSLYKAGVAKTGWGNLLYGIAASRQLDPHIRSAWAASNAKGSVSAADRQWFIDRGPGALIDRIDVPTLFVQGTVDTLFTLDEAITNFHSLRSRGVPTAMLWYCGGHGVCLTPAGDVGASSAATLAWLDHYIERKPVALPPRFTMVDQRGVSYTASDYPVDSHVSFGAHVQSTLELAALGGSGPAKPPAGSKDPLAGVAGGITPARAANAVDVKLVADKPVVVAGAPVLHMTYSGTTGPGERPTAVFAQLVDDATGLVVGNQVTPIPVTLDGKQHSLTLPLEAISFTLARGASVTLQVVATTVAYATPRLGGKVTMSVNVSLPESTLTPR